MELNDYARSPVPDDKTVSGWYIGLIYIGVGLALPIFLIAQTVGLNLGFGQAILATICAGIVLTISSFATGWIGGAVRLSTYYITQIAFGRFGAALLNMILTIAMFGWFGVTISMFATALDQIISLGAHSQIIWSIIGAILMISTAVYGFKGLGRLSLVAVPLLFLTMIWLVLHSLGNGGHEVVANYTGTKELSFGAITSILIGSWMVGVVVLPDLARYARKPIDGSFGGFLCFLPGFVVIMALSIVPILVFQGQNYVEIMLSVLSPLLGIVIVTLVAWTSNDNNLYASSLGLSSLIVNVPKWVITIVAGVIGTVLSIAGIMSGFIGFLVMLSILIPPMAGAYIADFITSRAKYLAPISTQKFCVVTSFGWVFGSCVAYLTTSTQAGGIEYTSLTTVPALDGLLSTFVLVYIIRRFFKAA